MTPGAYLRLRRIAAGVTIEDVAAMIAYRAENTRPTAPVLASVAHALRLVEGPRLWIETGIVSRLVGAFPFDRDVYDQLVLITADPASDLPRPLVCRVCGCTWHQPCDHDRYGPCAWVETADDEAPICSHCQLKGPANER